MRRARITYPGAYHHVMNRGYGGNPILEKEDLKTDFLDLIRLFSERLNIRIFAYCLMNNHYHLVLENTSGRMSDFLKQLNGNFGRIYRQREGGKGYVFQGRYRSMLIQDDPYLLTTIAYTLNNPVRAGLVKNFLEYDWSSGSSYFNEDDPGIVDVRYVENLFGDRTTFLNTVNKMTVTGALPVVETRAGKIMGREDFFPIADGKFDRRSGKESSEGKRIDDLCFEPLEKIFSEFNGKYGIDPDHIDTSSHAGKKMRGEFLVHLKDRGGLKYSDIKKMNIFSDLKFSSLGQLYKRTRDRR